MYGDVRLHESWWVPIDPKDVAQERELAILEHRCPDQAAKDWFRHERSWYRFHQRFPLIPPNENEGDFLDVWIERFHVSVMTKTASSTHRSEESIERRRECVREWWRKNGSAYRSRRRQDPRSPRRAVGPRS